jgi:hypothetical protein
MISDLKERTRNAAWTMAHSNSTVIIEERWQKMAMAKNERTKISKKSGIRNPKVKMRLTCQTSFFVAVRVRERGGEKNEKRRERKARGHQSSIRGALDDDI